MKNGIKNPVANIRIKTEADETVHRSKYNCNSFRGDKKPILNFNESKKGERTLHHRHISHLDRKQPVTKLQLNHELCKC